MKITCCKDCVAPKRHIGCYDKCPEYREQRAELDKVNEAERKVERSKRRSYRAAGQFVPQNYEALQESLMEVFMSDDINNLDPNDEGLKQIFGDRFHDATKEPAITAANAVHAANKVQKPQWEPVKPDPNWLDGLKACVKHIAIFGGLSFLVFYWQQAGLMDSSVAVPTMCICTALAGLGVGKNIRGDMR